MDGSRQARFSEVHIYKCGILVDLMNEGTAQKSTVVIKFPSIVLAEDTEI